MPIIRLLSVLISEAVANRLDFIYLAGGNQIKRRTICEFRRRHKNVIIKLFAKSVKLADEVGLVDREKIFALDGTKIRSSANQDQRKTRDEWVDVKNRLIKSVEDFLNEWERNEKQGDYDENLFKIESIEDAHKALKKASK